MTTYSNQPNETDGIDTFIGKNSPTVNYDTQDLLIGYSADIVRALLKFNLAVGTNPPQSLATVTSANLYLQCTNYAVTRTINIYRCLRNWVEAQATWNIYSTGNNWATAGCGGDGTDFDSTILGSLSISSTGSKQFTLNASGIAVVQGWINGTIPNYGFLLKDATEASNKNTFANSSHATATYRPKFEIEYNYLGVGSSIGFISQGFGMI